MLDDLLPHGLREIHMSGGKWADSEMMHQPESMGMGASIQNEWGIWQADGEIIRQVRDIVDKSVSSA